MILSATANVTLGENKIAKNKQTKNKTINNKHITTYFMQAADITWWVKRGKLQRRLWKSYMFSTGSEHVNMEAN